MKLKELKSILDEAAMNGLLSKDSILVIHCEIVVLEVSTNNRYEHDLIDFLLNRKVEYKSFEKKSEKNKSIIIIGLE